MPQTISKTARATAKIGIFIAVITIGSIAIHAFVLIIDFYMIKQPLYLNLQEDFIGSIFSFPMIPMIAVYSIFILAISLLWTRMKESILKTNEFEMKAERERVIIESLQRITGIISQHVAVHNNEILAWIYARKESGKTVSPDLESASNKISQSLSVLSDIAFLMPHEGPASQSDMMNYEKMLLERLEEVKEKKNVACLVK